MRMCISVYVRSVYMCLCVYGVYTHVYTCTCMCVCVFEDVKNGSLKPANYNKNLF